MRTRNSGSTSSNPTSLAPSAIEASERGLGICAGELVTDRFGWWRGKGLTFDVWVYERREIKTSATPILMSPGADSRRSHESSASIHRFGRSEQANSIMPADTCQDRPANSVHKPNFNMKSWVSIEVCRCPHRGGVLRPRPERSGLESQARDLFLPEAGHCKSAQ